MSKTTLKFIFATVLLGGFYSSKAEEFQGHPETRFEHQVCYEYHVDGTVEVRLDCGRPYINGPCTKSIGCLPVVIGPEL